MRCGHCGADKYHSQSAGPQHAGLYLGSQEWLCSKCAPRYLASINPSLRTPEHSFSWRALILASVLFVLSMWVLLT